MRWMTWPDTVDDVLGGDQAVMLGYVTPAGGVVLTPMTNFAARDRATGTVSVNSSVGAGKKLDRIRRDPRVALAFHTRRHGYSDRPEYVLVQGRGSLSPPIPDFPALMGDAWERFDGPRPRGTLWRRWLRVYDLRVEMRVLVERVVVWPDLKCSTAPAVYGAAMPAEPPRPQPLPGHGTRPRLDHVRAAGRAARLPEVLLGWVGADGFPVVVPVGIAGTTPDGMVLEAPGGLVPLGGRRAGLTAHSFTRYVTGQHQRIHTGWLDVAPPGQASYAPHTRAGHRLPPSVPLYRLAVGFETRRRYRRAMSPRPAR